jgi:TIR domain-containing protein
VARIFISHSSADKPFVYRLAIDLAEHDMPVWFDTWEIDTGDSFEQKIYEGIDASEYVIVVLSSNSVASKWVRKELTKALALEEQLGRKFIIPVRIADCKIPPKIRDRLYADFSASYLEPLERLVFRLRKLGLEDLNEPPEHALVPLVFERGIYLDSVQFERRIKALRPRLPEGFKFTFDQFVIAPDERYNELRHNLIDRKEHILSDPYYSADFSRDLSDRYHALLNSERHLIEGIRLISSGYVASTNPVFDIGVAVHWFARAIRSEILHLLWSSQNPDRADTSDYGRYSESLPFGSYLSAARFWEVKSVGGIDIGPAIENEGSVFAAHYSDYTSIAIPTDSPEYRFVYESRRCWMHELGGSEFYSKFVIPRLAVRYLTRSVSPFALTFDNWIAGLS